MKKLIIVDISSFIFRAFYAIRPLNSSDGTPVNAVYGVLSMMLKILTDEKPTHIMLARDTKEGSFRKELYNEYKANRSEPPDELKPQFSLIETLIEKMNLPSVMIPRYEADDIIASAVVQWRNYFDEIYIASSDKDLMQFIDEKVKMLDTKNDKVFDEKAVFEKMGVRPDQIVDYLSMLGDASDNVPGMKGIGEKGAAKLLEQYGTLENCFKHKDEITNKRVKEAFLNYEDDAYLSKKLITLVTDLNLNLNPGQTQFSFYATSDLLTYLDFLGFKSFKEKLKNFAQIEDNIVSEIPAAEFSKKKIINTSELIELSIQLKSCREIFVFQKIAIDESDRNTQELKSIYFFCDGFIYEISIATDLLNQNESVLFTDAISFLENLFIEDKLEVIGFDLKNFFYFLKLNKIEIDCKLFDLKLASFVINPEGHHQFLEVMNTFLGNIKVNNEEEYLAYFPELKKKLFEKLQALKLYDLFETVDTPLIKILTEMEFTGIYLDDKYYFKVQKDYEDQLFIIEEKIKVISQEEINLKSPKQVAGLLFDKLNFPVIKKTKTGLSTDSDVLIELSALGINEIPDLILQYRELDKLLSTYVKVLPLVMSKLTHRIHTHYDLTNAATGRLSSDSPNLQNIPTRTENGKRLRKGFIAKPGYQLISADYTQVELRILAHMSQDPTMLKAFKDNIDIHTQTASEMFEKPVNEVSKEDRNKAKAINFGLMYGQSSFGLSQNLHIERRDAKDFINNYFAKFNHVKIFLDTLKEQSERTGFAETMIGRKRFLKDIKSTNRTIKSMAERVAINSPIQGTAADIIKIAMIRIFHQLKIGKFKTKLLLQVHDELIFEAPEDEIKAVIQMIKHEMENAVTLSIPLTVDVNIGPNWYDLK